MRLIDSTRVLPLVAGVAAALLLAACSSPAGDADAGAPAAANSTAAAAVPAGPLVVYSERKPPLLDPILAAYTAETGVPIETRIDGADALIERLAAEGAGTPADVLITVDAGNLYQAAERNLLAPTSSAVLEANVPSNLRDAQGRWFGLSERARTIMYAKDRVDPATLSTYEALAEPQWRGKLCLRSSAKVYNQSLVATMIERLGANATRDVLKGWVANLAAPPFADDTLLLQAIAAGQCEVGITNTYYLGRLQKDDPAFAVAPFWPNQADAGVHVNISGAGVVAASDRPEQAKALLEWLASDTVQAKFAGLNYEYPVKPGMALDPIVAAWGEFKADPVDIAVAGRRQAEAVMLMNEAGWR
jgi:iron(III) transport system substrate-binding protein